MGNARNAIERTFSPEFRNRLDAWVSFESLPPEVIAQGGRQDGGRAGRPARAQEGHRWSSPPAGRAWLAEHGFDRLMGARPMGRIIQKKVKEPLAEKILFGELKEGGQVTIDAARTDSTAVKPTVPASRSPESGIREAGRVPARVPRRWVRGPRGRMASPGALDAIRRISRPEDSQRGAARPTRRRIEGLPEAPGAW